MSNAVCQLKNTGETVYDNPGRCAQRERERTSLRRQSARQNLRGKRLTSVPTRNDCRAALRGLADMHSAKQPQAYALAWGSTDFRTLVDLFFPFWFFGKGLVVALSPPARSSPALSLALPLAFLKPVRAVPAPKFGRYSGQS